MNDKPPQASSLVSPAHSFALEVDYHPPAPIKFFTVTEEYLNKLESTSEKEQYTIGATSLSVGIAASGWIAWLTSPPKEPVQIAVLVAVSLVLSLAGLVGVVGLYFFRKERKYISAQIRESQSARIRLQN